MKIGLRKNLLGIFFLPNALPPRLLLPPSRGGIAKMRYHYLQIFVANLKKFLMDPDEFELPKMFKPERFLSESGEVLKKELFVPFGIGKRICMGESLAKNELFIFFVRLLQKLEFTVTDPKPNPKQYTTGITRIPKPFFVRVTDRHL